MLKTEVAELIGSTNIFEIAAKTNRQIALNDSEKEVASQFDEWARKIGETGKDAENQIAAFVTRVVRDELTDAPSELLDMIFDRGTIGEFDDYEASIDPIKNTLVAYEAAHGGNVPRSHLDIASLRPVWRNKQCETDISFQDLRRNGWKTVSLLTEYAVKALENAMFADVFGAVNAAITQGAANFIVETTAMPTAASIDALALYVNDRANGNGVAVGLSKYIQAISKLPGYDSNEMLNELNRTGRLGMYDGVALHPISGAKKLGNDELLIPDKRIFGIAGKIGALDMKGDVHVYEEENINKEMIHIKVADFTYGYSFNKDSIENMCVIAIQG